MTDDEALERYESGYNSGYSAAYRAILQECARVLGYATDEGKLAALIAERESAIASLREICAAHGDNDWSDDLHLYDVLEKHLAPHLDASE